MEYTFGFLRTVSVACHHGIQGDKHTSFCEALDRIDLKLCHSIMPLLPTAFQMFGSCLRKELSGWAGTRPSQVNPPPHPNPSSRPLPCRKRAAVLPRISDSLKPQRAPRSGLSLRGTMQISRTPQRQHTFLGTRNEKRSSAAFASSKTDSWRTRPMTSVRTS